MKTLDINARTEQQIYPNWILNVNLTVTRDNILHFICGLRACYMLPAVCCIMSFHGRLRFRSIYVFTKNIDISRRKYKHFSANREGIKECKSVANEKEWISRSLYFLLMTISNFWINKCTKIIKMYNYCYKVKQGQTVHNTEGR